MMWMHAVSFRGCWLQIRSQEVTDSVDRNQVDRKRDVDICQRLHNFRHRKIHLWLWSLRLLSDGLRIRLVYEQVQNTA